MSRKTDVDGELMPIITPGEILREEFLVPLNMKQKTLAEAIGIPATRVSEIIKGTRRISADTALRLSIFFGNSSQYWINLQNQTDLETLKRTKGKELEAQIQPYQYA